MLNGDALDSGGGVNGSRADKATAPRHCASTAPPKRRDRFHAGELLGICCRAGGKPMRVLRRGLTVVGVGAEATA
jgi:hypothetical protein